MDRPADRVCLVEYDIRTDTDEPVDATTPDRPLELRPGAGTFLAAFEAAVLDAPPGAWIDFEIPPADAYGPADESKVRRIPLAQFPESVRPAAGTSLVVRDRDGNTTGLRVRAIEDDVAVCDFNHPLAGRTLKVRLRVLGSHPADA